MLKPIRTYTSGLATAINQILTKLLSYNDLWKTDKQKYTNQFASKFHTYSDYNEMMNIFSKVNQIFNDSSDYENLYSLRLSLKQFNQALKFHCQDWIHHYGQYFYIKISNKLKETNDLLNNLSHGLQHDADTVPDLKYVLNIIDQINQQQESIEHTIDEIEQSYEILHQHGFEYPQNDWILIQTLNPRLKELIQQSHRVQYHLKSIRERFREIVQYDIEFFQEIINKFISRFVQFGPYTITNDLQQSFLLLHQYQNELNKIEQQKLELINMMKLFHLPLINYPELISLHNEFNDLNTLFDLYNEFKRNEKLWANILWTELDINQLISNVDGFLKQFRRLSSEIKTTTIGHAVQTYLLSISIDKYLYLHFFYV